MNEFSNLGLQGPTLKALDREGYETPTPIQSKAIPVVLAGSDVLGIAQTGTGKTAAFALPILHRLKETAKAPPRRGCRVLVLSPTRELASQIAKSFETYGRFMNISVTTVFGGVGHRPQIRALARGVDVLVATPGRLLDHLSTGAANLRETEVLVLDEADQMLDLGFVKPIRSIVAGLPQQRQTLFFSATMPAPIKRLANEFLTNPTTVSVSPVSSTAGSIDQRVVHLETSQKRQYLAHLISNQQMFRTLVFTRTKRGADRVAKYLQQAGVEVASIHGNKSQNQRERALEAFRQAKIQVLVATDIAARGIDIDDVTHVVNFELPDVPEAYVHRIGRTARAGASGSAISLCDRDELKQLYGIEHLTKQRIPADRLAIDDAGQVTLTIELERAEAPHSPSSGRRNRSRGSRDNKPSDSKPSGHRDRGPKSGKRPSQSRGGRSNTGKPKRTGGAKGGRGSSPRTVATVQ